MKKNNKGFTLAELLIVVAIIGVLIAIAMPTFMDQLEKAKQSTDAANIRAAYAEAVAQALTSESGTGSATTGKMTHSGTFNLISDATVGKESISSLSVTKGKTVTVSVESGGTIKITAGS